MRLRNQWEDMLQQGTSEKEYNKYEIKGISPQNTHHYDNSRNEKSIYDDRDSDPKDDKKLSSRNQENSKLSRNEQSTLELGRHNSRDSNSMESQLKLQKSYSYNSESRESQKIINDRNNQRNSESKPNLRKSLEKSSSLREFEGSQPRSREFYDKDCHSEKKYKYEDDREYRGNWHDKGSRHYRHHSPNSERKSRENRYKKDHNKESYDDQRDNRDSRDHRDSRDYRESSRSHNKDKDYRDTKGHRSSRDERDYRDHNYQESRGYSSREHKSSRDDDRHRDSRDRDYKYEKHSNSRDSKDYRSRNEERSREKSKDRSREEKPYDYHFREKSYKSSNGKEIELSLERSSPPRRSSDGKSYDKTCYNGKYHESKSPERKFREKSRDKASSENSEESQMTDINLDKSQKLCDLSLKKEVSGTLKKENSQSSQTPTCDKKEKIIFNDLPDYSKPPPVLEKKISNQTNSSSIVPPLEKSKSQDLSSSSKISFINLDKFIQTENDYKTARANLEATIKIEAVVKEENLENDHKPTSVKIFNYSGPNYSEKNLIAPIKDNRSHEYQMTITEKSMESKITRQDSYHSQNSMDSLSRDEKYRENSDKSYRSRSNSHKYHTDSSRQSSLNREDKDSKERYISKDHRERDKYKARPMIRRTGYVKSNDRRNSKEVSSGVKGDRGIKGNVHRSNSGFRSIFTRNLGGTFRFSGIDSRNGRTFLKKENNLENERPKPYKDKTFGGKKTLKQRMKKKKVT